MRPPRGWAGDDGNLVTAKKDANGDGLYTGAGGAADVNDSNTFDKASKLTQRTDNMSATNSTVLSAKTGSMTDDGRTYLMVYDAWKRLRQVKKHDGTLLAEYRYNGLGHRITWQDDATNDSVVNGLTCPPKPDPPTMRVPTGRGTAWEALEDEADKAFG